jgi:hypothetical protein
MMVAKMLLALPLVCILQLTLLPISVTGLPEIPTAVHPISISSRGGAQRPKNRAVDAISSAHLNDKPPPGNSYLETSVQTSFASVVVVAAANLCLNILRPDPFVSWQMKVPRILWEIAIMAVAMTATDTALPAMYVLLAVVLGSTAMVDLFFWAPLYATFSQFESCRGGIFTKRVCRSDYTKGIGRLVVVFQCVGTGFFYLMSAITAMGSFTALRDAQKIERHLRTMQQWEELRRQNGGMLLKSS